jgi:hypothetical protein
MSDSKDYDDDEETQIPDPAEDEPAEDEPDEDEPDEDEPDEDEPDEDEPDEDEPNAAESADESETTEVLDEEPLALIAPAGANDEPENEFETFASTDAPWVGAEKDWIEKKESIAPEPVSKEDKPLTKPAQLDNSEDEDDEDDVGSGNLLSEGLTRDDLMAVIASIPPPPPGLSLGAKLGIGATIIAVLGIASGAVLWIYTEMQLEREQERIEMRVERDRERISMRLESAKQIKDLQKQIDGAKNREMELALRAQLEQAKAAQDSLETEEKYENKEEEDEEEDDWEIEARKRRHQRKAEEEATGGQELSAGDNPYDKATEEAVAAVADTPATPTAVAAPKDDVSDLLDQATPAPSIAPSPTVNSLPIAVGGLMQLSPSREQVKSTMDSVAARVKSCGNGTGGRIILKLAVSGPTGRVISAEPHTSDYAGTPVGICASRAVRLARFPKFQKTHLVIKYPFDL